MTEPRSDAERNRMAYSRLRQRIMDGRWRLDAKARLTATVGEDRAVAWGDACIDIGTPLLRQASVRRATLYLRPPYLEHEDVEAAAYLNGLFRSARLGSLMTGVLQSALGLNDAAVRFEVGLDPDGEVYVRLYPVSVSSIMARGRFDDPTQPRRIYEEVKHDGADVWRVWTVEEVHLETADGTEIKRTRQRHGQGRCPWVLWHAVPTNRPFTPYANGELVDLTLSLSVAESFRAHSFFEACWPQRYAVGVQPAGMAVDTLSGVDARSTVTADPATVLLLEGTGENQPMVGQWSVGADPASMSDAVSRQHRRASLAIGAAGSDVYRGSGEARSAYALEITRQAQRSQQVAMAPLMQPSDEYLATAVAEAVNLHLPGVQPLPVDGWRIRYRVLSPSMEEVDLAIKLLSAGLISPTEARLLLDPFSDPPTVAEVAAGETADQPTAVTPDPGDPNA